MAATEEEEPGVQEERSGKEKRKGGEGAWLYAGKWERKIGGGGGGATTAALPPRRVMHRVANKKMESPPSLGHRTAAAECRQFSCKINPVLLSPPIFGLPIFFLLRYSVLAGGKMNVTQGGGGE